MTTMFLRLSERRWADLVTVMGIYALDQDLQSLQDLASNRVIDGLRIGIASPSLFNRLELPSTELSAVARATGLSWAHRLSESLTEIIRHGEWHPVLKMTQECEDIDGTGELISPEPKPQLLTEPLSAELQEMLDMIHNSKLPAAREASPPGWFI